MATNFTDPEIATTAGSLDDAVFDEGKPLTSFALRQLARNSNRWLSAPEQIGHLAWKAVNGTVDYSHLATGQEGRNLHIARMTRWSRVAPPILVHKMPGTASVTVQFSYFASYAFYFSATSSLSPNPEENAIECAATSTTVREDEMTCTVRVNEGSEEELSFWIKGKPTGVSQSGYGTTPNLIISCDGKQFLLSSADVHSDYLAQTTGARVLNWTTAGTYLDVRTTNALTGERMLDVFDVVGVANDNKSVAVIPDPLSFPFSLVTQRYAHALRCPRVQIESITLYSPGRQVT